jgi:hypothetical protein
LRSATLSPRQLSSGPLEFHSLLSVQGREATHKGWSRKAVSKQPVRWGGTPGRGKTAEEEEEGERKGREKDSSVL